MCLNIYITQYSFYWGKSLCASEQYDVLMSTKKEKIKSGIVAAVIMFAGGIWGVWD